MGRSLVGIEYVCASIEVYVDELEDSRDIGGSSNVGRHSKHILIDPIYIPGDCQSEVHIKFVSARKQNVYGYCLAHRLGECNSVTKKGRFA